MALRKEMLDGRIAVYDNGVITEVIDGKEEALYPSKSSGYYAIRVGGEQFMVHRLVASAFVENPENKSIVNHKDGNKHNNAASNLEWVTPSENISHAHNIGLFKNERKKSSVIDHRISIGLPEEQYDAILDMRQIREYRKYSVGEIVRTLIQIGLNECKNDKESE